MATYSTNEFRGGLKIMLDGDPCSIIENEFVKPGKGQALYSSVSFGAGGAIGSLYAGYIWDNVSGAAMFLVAAVLAVIGAVVAWRFIGSHAVAT